MYTKGEWKVTRWDSQEGEIHVSADDGKNLMFVANCGHTGDDCILPYNGDAEANARLIAAAPELLEALREILQIIHYGEPLGKANEVIYKALAKAENDR